MGSRRVSTYVRDGEDYRIIVQAEAAGRASEERLDEVYVAGVAARWCRCPTL